MDDRILNQVRRLGAHMNQICALCQRRAPLKRSHLFPKALYRLARQVDSDGELSPDPLLIRRDKTIQSSLQTTCRLLCADCEDLFSKRGERTVLAECARDDSFILRDKLRREIPLRAKGPWACFSGRSLSTVDTEAYRFFVASVLWRASVGDWRGVVSPHWRGLIGSHEKGFRDYLLRSPSADLPWPLLVAVASDEDPVGFFSGPVPAPVGSCIGYNFHVFGIHFFMFVGAILDAEVLSLFSEVDGSTIFELKPQRLHAPLRRIAEFVHDSPPARNLRGRL